jgi:hypothetical protein
MMSELIRKIVVVAMMGALSTGAFAQGKGKDKRPPKEPVKVIDGKGGGSRPPNPPPQKPKDDRGKKKP